MASKNYNPYNYPYQQSFAQQYPTYQAAPAPNNVPQPSRQYQQPPTTQGNDYMSYQGPSCGAQSSGYTGSAQDNSWNGSSYGGNRETTRGAAAVLGNVSNTDYTPNSTGATQSSFTPANNATSQATRYSSGNSNSPRMQPQQTHAAHATQSSYGQSQARPRSVNTNRAQQPVSRGLPSPATGAGYPSQRAQTINNQQQQRSASPAQNHHSNNTSVPPTSTRNAPASTAVPQQYTDYDGRQLASVEASRSNQTVASSTSYNHGSTLTVAPPGPTAPPPSSVAEIYNGQGSITVDPMAVYNPWPEYQGKQEALRAQKAVEDAAHAEEERIDEETRKAEESKQEEEHNRQKAEPAVDQLKPKTKKAQKQQQILTEATSASVAAVPATGDALEAEIRAMMAKMRELNSKDPALLARIWEEERRAKVADKFPAVQNKIPAQATPAPPAQAVQLSTPQVANQRKKAAPKETNSVNAVKASTPRSAPAAPVRAQTQAVLNSRPRGNTIWPAEKKTHLAAAAATYLISQNPGRQVDSTKILSMLNGNPSHIELCGLLEQMGLKLDRAAFAKNLLTAVPDVNSSTHKAAQQPVPVQHAPVPAAVMKREIATPAAASPAFAPATASPANRSSYPSFSASASPAATPVPVTEMVPITPELKQPANKEEAARKRNISDLIDMTLLSDDEDMGPPPKRLNSDSMYSYASSHPHIEDAMVVDSEPVVNNFPIASVPPRSVPEPAPGLRHVTVADPLDKKNALRRNNYNPATIARDVLLACGRHPSERQLNQHLDVLRANLPVGYDSDLSTIKWDILDPGKPPPGYFKDSVQALTKDADDEDDSEDEDREARLRAQSNAIGAEGGVPARVQALPEAINPFKQKKRGRPPRHSFSNDTNDTAPVTPKRSPSVANMSASAPRPSAPSVGYTAFKSATELGPDGKPLPKKRGRPVGWRKAIHGSASAWSKPNAIGHTGPHDKHQPSQPSSLRHVNTGTQEPIRIHSRSPSVANRVPRYQSYKCKWQSCSADLHNLDTLKKHVFKVHRKETLGNTLECLWDDCGKEVTNFDPNTNTRIEKHTPHSFDLESNWRGHIQQNHFDPLSWELGDGPASGLSGNED
jgi:hypothetical protein